MGEYFVFDIETYFILSENFHRKKKVYAIKNCSLMMGKENGIKYVE